MKNKRLFIGYADRHISGYRQKRLFAVRYFVVWKLYLPAKYVVCGIGVFEAMKRHISLDQTIQDIIPYHRNTAGMLQ